MLSPALDWGTTRHMSPDSGRSGPSAMDGTR
ncbi:MAG: hypothetical protein JNL31_18560 [Tabrizicola sp.]|nr:hypothetical protein [Tabrizicola sp.]